MADRDNGNARRSGGKKVGFAPNLTSFENPSPSNGDGRAVWDSETDHLLSYFLGGDFQHGSGVPEFSNSETPNCNFGDSSLVGTAGDSGQGKPQPNRKDSGAPAGGSEDELEEPMAPPTPKAPQFYARASAYSNSGQQPPPQAAIQSSSSSSSSSLSTMANTLVSGGPMLLHQMQQQQQQQVYASMMAAAAAQQQMQGVPSPVSPAAMIGTPENLMLPPPQGQHPFMVGQAYHGAAAEATAGNPIAPRQHGAAQPPHHPMSSPASQQQHMAWLRDLNAMAKAGYQQQGQDTQSSKAPTPAMPPPAPVPTPQQQSVNAAAQLGIPFTAFAPHMAFYGHAAAAAAAAMQQSKNPAPEESEEKRAKRLERNRESARKSRRRKKERLSAVESQVERLHQKIANARQQQIDKLVPGLRKCRSQQMAKFGGDSDSGAVPAVDPATVMTLVRETGPNSPVFQAVLEFQFNSLQALLFPRYHRLWLWLTLNDDAFFAAGKEDYIKRDPDRMIVRTSSGKISSKQVGDEWYNGQQSSENKRQASRGASNGEESFATRSCPADDAVRMWPLTCYEHQFSVDQEEKFLALHKKIQEGHDVKQAWRQCQTTAKAVSSLRHAMEYVAEAASNREERTLVGVLRVDQISKYQQWIVMNHDRCSRSLSSLHQKKQSQLQTDEAPPTPTAFPSSQQNESLEDICLRLERVLQISKSDR